MNKFVFAGNLLSKKNAVTSGGLAFIRATLTDGESSIEVCCFKKNRDDIEKIPLGTQVKVTGKLRNRQYTDKNGEVRYGLDVRIDDGIFQSVATQAPKAAPPPVDPLEGLDEIPFP